MTYREASELIKGFENGTYPASEWTHYSHFVMALWYAYHQPLCKARQSIKEGIKRYNILVGGKNTDDSGYHETITEFYIRIIYLYQLHTPTGLSYEQLLVRMNDEDFINKDFPLKFYSKEKLMSKEARKNWVRPNLKPISISF